MADDQQNPFTMMGMMQMMQPNKYINQAYKDKPLPIPGFLGTPTDAQGNPIQSFTDAQKAHDAWQPPAAAQPPGTTLNSSNPFANVQIPRGQNTAVAQPRGGMSPDAWNALSPADRGAAQGAMNQYASGLAMMPSGNNFVASGSNPSGSNPQASNALAWMNAGGQNFSQMANRGQPAAAPPPQNPIDMRQAYLTALANPGKVTTPGATIQPSAPIGQPNVLDAFLKNRQAGPAAPAAGGYSNKPFFDTLSQLRSNA